MRILFMGKWCTGERIGKTSLFQSEKEFIVKNCWICSAVVFKCSAAVFLSAGNGWGSRVAESQDGGCRDGNVPAVMAF